MTPISSFTYILQQQKFHQVQQKVENLGTGICFIIYNHFSSPSYSANLIIELSPIPNSLPLPYNFIPHIPPSAHQFSQRSLGVKSERDFYFLRFFSPSHKLKFMAQCKSRGNFEKVDIVTRKTNCLGVLSTISIRHPEILTSFIFINYIHRYLLIDLLRFRGIQLGII